MNRYAAWKALLWEELYVGGSIVLAVLGVVFGIAVTTPLTLPKIVFFWEEIDQLCYYIVFLSSIFLLLQISNSGEMHIGIPHRILALPVNTSTIVTNALLVRILLVVFLTVLSRIIVVYVLSFFGHYIHISEASKYLYIDMFRRTFPFEFRFPLPLILPTIIHGIVFVTMQFVCWLFVFSPFLVGWIIGFVLLLIGTLVLAGSIMGWSEMFRYVTDLGPWVRMIGSTFNLSHDTLSFLIFVILTVYVFLVWFLSIRIVTKIRSGSTKETYSMIPSIVQKIGERNLRLFFSKFPNIQIAQVWFELNNNGFLIPVWTLLFSLILFGVYFLLLFILKDAQATHKLSKILYPTPMLSFIPYLALLFSGLVWYLRVTRKLKSSLYTWMFTLPQLPIVPKERINAYWIAGNVNLLITLPIIWLIEFIYQYRLLKDRMFSDSFIALTNAFPSQIPFTDVWTFGWQLGITLWGITVIVGIIVWLIMFNPGGLMIVAGLIFLFIIPDQINVSLSFREYGLTIVYLLDNLLQMINKIVSILLSPLYYVLPSRAITETTIVICIVYCVYIFLLMTRLFRAWQYHVLQRREAVSLIFLFILIFAGITPWYGLGQVHVIPLLGTTLFFSALCTNAWLRWVLSAHGYTFKKGAPQLKYDQDVRDAKEGSSIYPILSGYILPVVLVIVVIASYGTSISVNRKIATYFQNNGLPTSLKQIDEQYHALSDSENLCKRYCELFPMLEEIKKERYEKERAFFEKLSKGTTNSNEGEHLRALMINYCEILLENKEPLPRMVYQAYKEYIENTYSRLVDALHEVALSGLKQGHYPVDLTQGYSVELAHLSVLREFTQVLILEAMMKAVEEDYERMLKAFRSMVSIFTSLENEPIYISQLVRVGLVIRMLNSMEWILNQKILPENTLSQMNDIIRQCSIPKAKRSLFNNALHTELLMNLSLMNTLGCMDFYFGNPSNAVFASQNQRDSMVATWLSVIGLLYPRGIEQMITVDAYATLRQVATHVTVEENVSVPEKHMFDNFIDRLLFGDKAMLTFLSYPYDPPYWLYPTLSITFPALTRGINNELRYLIFVNLAQTAIAIERYRILHGALPGSLDVLVPEYLPEIPKDPYHNSKPITYIIDEDSSYKIYSFGVDQEDDAGIKRDNTRGIRNMFEGDYVFTVQPLTLRNQPPIIDETTIHTLKDR